MALKKSELYSSLWSSCDELRGGMDASQYKDYVLVLLFVKYVSDKYAGVPYAPITIPDGASFKDMVALKGKTDIGDQINKKIIGPLAKANKLSDMPDFNDANKLGSGKEMVDRLTNLIAIFENKALDFSEEPRRRRRHPGRRLRIPDAPLRHRERQEQGPVLHPCRSQPRHGADHRHPRRRDEQRHHRLRPHLRLRLAAAEGRRRGRTRKVTLYGQEKDAATAGLARMNMILHNNPTALIKQGNTLANPLFTERRRQLKTFDFVVANPPVQRQALEYRHRSAQRSATSASSTTARRPPSRAITPTCCTSSARSRAPAKAPAFCRMACSSGATPRPTSAATSSARATSRASSACPPTSFTAPASPPASSCSTRRTPTPARASS